MLKTGDVEIREVEIEVETHDGTEWEYRYKTHRLGHDTYKIVLNAPGERKKKRTGSEAEPEVKAVIKDMSIHRDMTHDELIDNTCAALRLKRDEVKGLEIEVEFADGNGLEVKHH